MILTDNDVFWLTKTEEKDSFLLKSAYSALDACVPCEIQDVLEPKLDRDTRRIYEFEHACQGAALTMTLRGVRIDEVRRQEAIEVYEREEEGAAIEISALSRGVWDILEPRIGKCTCPYTGEVHKHHLWPKKVPHDQANCRRCELPRLRLAPVNPNSSPQLCHLFYDLWGVRKRVDKETGNPTVDKNALEEIRGEALKVGRRDVAEAAHAGIRAKAARKQIGYLRARTGEDGRMRSTTTVGTATTGRWSASKAPDWTGWNIQQLADRIRHIIVADPELELGYADLEQAESHIVAYDSGDEAYIEAHKTGDVHTFVCRLMWPSLDWTGDLKRDRGLADIAPDFDPYHSRRDYGKHFQHGGNLGRSAAGVAREIHCPLKEAEVAMARMYGGKVKGRFDPVAMRRDPDQHFEGAFPGVKLRHKQLWAEIQRTGITVSCLGRKRQFLGRTWDTSTLREALGQLQQSPIADILNLALYRVWRDLDLYANVWDTPHPNQPNRVWLLAQVHDAILFQYRKGDVGALREVQKRMLIPILINGRELTIPVEMAVGPNWSKAALRKVKL